MQWKKIFIFLKKIRIKLDVGGDESDRGVKGEVYLTIMSVFSGWWLQL